MKNCIEYVQDDANTDPSEAAAAAFVDQGASAVDADRRCLYAAACISNEVVFVTAP